MLLVWRDVCQNQGVTRWCAVLDRGSCWIRNELFYRRERGGGRVRAARTVGGDRGWKKPSEQTASLVHSCLFNVTALTDTTGPEGCLQDNTFSSFRGNNWQFCTALDCSYHTAGEFFFCRTKLCSVINLLLYLYWGKNEDKVEQNKISAEVPW